MRRETAALGDRTFDVAIVGGGITGACLAFDAASRGMAVALIDKDDWGAATSAASSKLLHGGLRYLQQLRFAKVRESATERLHFQNLAPHLLRWVPFVVPTYRGLARGRPLLAAAMTAYGALCAGLGKVVRDPSRRVPSGGWLSAEEVRTMVPGFAPDDLTGGRLFHECQIQDTERMTLAFVEGAVREGAIAANYVRAEDFVLEDGRVVGVRAVDRVAGSEIRISARLVLYAAGPWIRRLNARLEGRAIEGLVTGLSRGAHLVTRPLTRDVAVALPTRRPSESVIDRGGRHVFVIPWRDHSLVGTSYGPHEGDPDDVAPTAGDVDSLIGDVNDALGAGTIRREDVRWAYAGLYPLTADEIRPDVYQGTGDWRVLDHESADGLPGLMSVFGAKYTTARRLAEEAVDRAAERLGGSWPGCRTRDLALPAGEINDLEAYRASRRRDLRDRFDQETIDHLVTAYGRRLEPLLGLIDEHPALAERLSPKLPVLAAQIVHAARHEMAVHLDDAVFRRTGLGTLGDPGAAALERAAREMGAEAGWDEARRCDEIARVRERFRW